VLRRGQSGMPGDEYADGMVEHDGQVGQSLKALDDLGIAHNTIVVYSTNSGPNQFSWPEAATTPSGQPECKASARTSSACAILRSLWPKAYKV
jgi:arylsulfatase A-like enzyme